MDTEDFLTLEELPGLFQTVIVSFRYENGGESRFSLVPGAAFPTEKIPQLPKKQGFTARWKGLEEANLDQVLFDLTFEAEYSAFEAVLASSDGESGKPLILVQGGFTPDSSLEITDWTEAVPLEEGQTLIKAKSFEVKNAQYLTSLRFCLYDWEPEDHSLLIRDKDGSWRKAEANVDGSYLVAALQEGDNAVAQIREAEFPWIYLAAGGVLTAALLVWILNKRKR